MAGFQFQGKCGNQGCHALALVFSGRVRPCQQERWRQLWSRERTRKEKALLRPGYRSAMELRQEQANVLNKCANISGRMSKTIFTSFFKKSWM